MRANRIVQVLVFFVLFHTALCMAQSSEHTSYTGPNHELVRSVLKTVADGYSCSPVRAPAFPSSFGCVRDGEIYKAQQLAWGSECSAQIGNSANAAQDAGLMLESLKSAAGRCGSTHAACLTDKAVPCTQLAMWTGISPSDDGQGQSAANQVPPQASANSQEAMAQAAAAQAALAAAQARATAPPPAASALPALEPMPPIPADLIDKIVKGYPRSIHDYVRAPFGICVGQGTPSAMGAACMKIAEDFDNMLSWDSAVNHNWLAKHGYTGEAKFLSNSARKRACALGSADGCHAYGQLLMDQNKPDEAKAVWLSAPCRGSEPCRASFTKQFPTDPGVEQFTVAMATGAGSPDVAKLPPPTTQAEYESRVKTHDEQVADLRQRADEAESEAEQAESLAQQAKDTGDQQASSGGGLLGGLVIIASGGIQMKEELDAQKKRKEADDLREQLREMGEEVIQPPALQNSIADDAGRDYIGEAKDKALGNINAAADQDAELRAQQVTPRVQSAADTAGTSQQTLKATAHPVGSAASASPTSDDSATTGGRTTMPPQPPQYGTSMKSCVTDVGSSNVGTPNEKVSFQNSCSVAVNAVIVFANKPDEVALDDRLGPGGGEDAYGSGPFRTYACLHGYSVVAAGTTRHVHYSDSEFACLYNGQF